MNTLVHEPILVQFPHTGSRDHQSRNVSHGNQGGRPAERIGGPSTQIPSFLRHRVLIRTSKTSIKGREERNPIIWKP
jgi:hypothetical protein